MRIAQWDCQHVFEGAKLPLAPIPAIPNPKHPLVGVYLKENQVLGIPKESGTSLTEIVMCSKWSYIFELKTYH